jgi:hypothetical protein
MKSAFIASLDLGQSNDFSALTISELVPAHPFQLLTRHMERFQLHTPYPTQVEATGERLAKVKELGRTLLIVDQTGVGRAVVDMFKAASFGVVLWPVTIATSAMQGAKRDEQTGDWVVPKKDLIGAMVALAHSGRLEVSNKLPLAKVFQEELRNFRMKITAAANVTFEAWREGAHDDLVLSEAMACWAAQRWASPGGLL